MEEYHNDNIEYNESEIDVMELFRKLLKEWKFIFKCCCVAVAVGVILAISAVSTYTVTSKMAPESTSKSPGGSLGSLASLAGINLGSISSADAISPDLYPEIVSSVPFMTELFSIPVTIVHKKDTIQTDYYEYILDYQKETWYKKIFGAPGKLLGLMLSGGKESKELGTVDPAHLTKNQELVIKSMRKNISISVDKKTYVMTLSVTDQNPEIALILSENVTENLKAYITSYRTEKARHDLQYYEQLYREAQDVYFKSQQRYAEYADANQGVVRQSVMIEQERLQNEMQLNYQLYNACAQQVQQAKANVQLETPVCVTIQPPTVPLKDNESGAKTCAVCLFLGLLLSVIWILWARDWIHDFKNTEDSIGQMSSEA